MLKDIKLGMKLLRYSYGFKTNIALIVFFLIIGGLMMALPKVSAFIFGGTYVYISFVMFIQMSYMLLSVQMVSVAPHRKLFEQTFPDAIMLISTMLWYLVLTILVAVCISLRPHLRAEYTVSLVVVALGMAVMLIYFGVCYKFFLPASILFSFTFMYMLMYGREVVTIYLLKYVGVNLFANFVIGLVILLVACLLSMLLRKLFYKRAMSKMAMGAIVRQAMKQV